MNRIAAICACALLFACVTDAQAGVVVRKPLVTAPAILRQAPPKPVCTDDQGAVSRPGDYPWTSRTSDGVSHDCTPFGCNMDTGLCRTSAANTNQCRPGFSWYAPASCSQCGPNSYWDDAAHTCKQGIPNPQ